MLLAALVVRRDRGQGDQFFSQGEGFGGGHGTRAKAKDYSEKIALYCASENATLNLPALYSTGRLMMDGFSSISSLALAASTMDALRSSLKARQVVPFLLTSTSHGNCCSHCSTVARSRPCFLKSWKVKSSCCAASQVRAFLTVSQLGIP